MSRDNGRINRTMRLAALALVAGVSVFTTVGLSHYFNFITIRQQANYAHANQIMVVYH